MKVHKKIDSVILVNKSDTPIGTEPKLPAHQKGLLHRAFSVFIFNRDGEMLLQRRAWEKYHSPGLWSNACCSHPRPGEDTAAAAHRRLKEELGFDSEIEEKFHFIYRAEFDNGLIEHELDHVFIGQYDGEITPDPAEVAEIRWINPNVLKQEIAEKPDEFTVWFKIVLERVLEIL
ncbi:MAG: isopentenyl-diphosphate Delta-isomerase [Calditrichaeota bacterium]|nr:isopentenyl-diphosphate Delta-isomerase [Calditrichota bacterium]